MVSDTPPQKSPKRRLSDGRSRWRHGLGIIPLAFFCVFFVLPLVTIFARSFSGDDLGTGGDWFSVLTNTRYWKVAWFSLWQAVLSTLLTLVIALPGAYVFARFSFPGKSLLRTLMTVAFVLPPVVVGAAFLTLLESHGPVSQLLTWAFGPVDWQHSIWAILVAHMFFNYSVVVRTVGGYWANLNRDLEDAARGLGSSRARTFWRITLPQLRPALSAATVLVFLFTFTSFGVIMLLGGPTYANFEVEIFRQATQSLNLSVASVLALIQMATVASLVVVCGRINKVSGHVSKLVGYTDSGLRPRGIGQKLFVACNLLVVLALICGPMSMLLIRALSTPQGLSFSSFTSLLSTPDNGALYTPPIVAVRNSLIFASIATAISVICGLAGAVYLSRASSGNIGDRPRPGRLLRGLRRGLETLLTLPLGTSAVTLGFGYLILISSLELDSSSSVFLIPAAQALIGTPLVVRSILPVMNSIDNNLRHVASSLGASRWRTWREVDFALTARALWAGAALAFAASLGEFGATLFIARAETPTLPTAIFRLLARPGTVNYSQAMALSCILMLITAITIWSIERFRSTALGDF